MAENLMKNIFKSIDKKNHSFLNSIANFIREQMNFFTIIVMLMLILTSLIWAYVSAIDKTIFNEPAKYCFINILSLFLLVIIEGFLEFKNEQLKEKIVSEKIKIFEEMNHQNSLLKLYLENSKDEKVFNELLILLDKKERTKDEKAKMIELILQQEEITFKNMEEQKKLEKVNCLKEKYQLKNFDELKQKEKEIGFKYNL
jgi:hypothetical protein